MKRKAMYTFSIVLAAAALAALINAPIGSAAPILGSAQTFAVLSHETVTNGHSEPNPTTQVYGNLGVTPGTSVTGFNPDGTVTGGTIRINDPVAQLALSDATTAYNTLAGLPLNYDYTDVILGSVGHTTLTPGVYHFGTTAQLTGTLTLDCQGNPNARFVFQIASTLTTADSSLVNVINGNSTTGVYWTVGSSATLGTDSTFAGNIIALASVSLNPRADILSGRALALGGAVTLIDNLVSNDAIAEDFASNRSDFGSYGFSNDGESMTPTATPTATSTFHPPTATSTATPTATSTPDLRGRIEVVSDRNVSGLLMYGNKASKGIAGLPGAVVTAKKHYLCHYHSSDRWWTGVAISNPNATAAHIILKAYSTSGTSLGQDEYDVPALGKTAKLVSTIFSAGTGWILVDSDSEVVCVLLYGDKKSGGLGAVESAELGTTLVLPHFHYTNKWWTGVSVANPNTASVTVTLTAYSTTGAFLAEASKDVAPMGKMVGLVNDLLGISYGQTGWIEVNSNGGPVGALLVFGDTETVPNEIAAMPAVVPSTQMYLTNFFSDTKWWTGISVVNPDLTTAAEVTLSAQAPNGVLIDEVTQTIPPRNKIVGLMSNLFDLGGHTEGWVEARSTGVGAVPIVGLELINGNDDNKQAWGLAGISSQPEGPKLYMAHYDITWQWWTWFAVANMDDSFSANVQVTAFSDDGRAVTGVNRVIPPNGRIMEDAAQMLGITK